MKNKIILLVLLFFSLSLFGQPKETTQNFREIFKSFKAAGCIIIYDKNKDEYIRYNLKRCRMQFTPASTFKIPNSLIGLETGVIEDENFIIKWDSVVRDIPEWNRDQDLKSAIKYSTVPYYQELARRVGMKKMLAFIKKIKYGNMNLYGGIDKFWLQGGLRISPDEQIEFLKKFYDYKLPFSKRNIDIVKKIIIREDTSGYILRGKTGWGYQDGMGIGWFVGYLEQNNNVYFFATNIESEKPDADFAKSRIEITKAVLKKIGLL
jgi:beta-lactamase class D